MPERVNMMTGDGLLVLVHESLVEVHNLALDTGADNLSVLIEEVGDALGDGAPARSAVSIILGRDSVLIVVCRQVGVPLPLTLLVASDHFLGLKQRIPLNVPLVQIENSHQDEVRDRTDSEDDLALGERVVEIVDYSHSREANSDERDQQTPVHERVNLLPSRQVVENSADFIVQSVLHRLPVPLVNLGGNVVLVRH
ncbi:hypothetical protein PFISCL1PPCAC_23243, partial [Pristionchus fissidentatus]